MFVPPTVEWMMYVQLVHILKVIRIRAPGEKRELYTDFECVEKLFTIQILAKMDDGAL